MDVYTKHVPQRRCVACRTVRPKADLMRLTGSMGGRVVFDQTGTLGGRGAYLCPQLSCWKHALARRCLERALRLEMIHPDDRRTLEQFAQSLEETTVNME